MVSNLYVPCGGGGCSTGISCVAVCGARTKASRPLKRKDSGQYRGAPARKGAELKHTEERSCISAFGGGLLSGSRLCPLPSRAPSSPSFTTLHEANRSSSSALHTTCRAGKRAVLYARQGYPAVHELSYRWPWRFILALVHVAAVVCALTAVPSFMHACGRLSFLLFFFYMHDRTRSRPR